MNWQEVCALPPSSFKDKRDSQVGGHRSNTVTQGPFQKEYPAVDCTGGFMTLFTSEGNPRVLPCKNQPSVGTRVDPSGLPVNHTPWLGRRHYAEFHFVGLLLTSTQGP